MKLDIIKIVTGELIRESLFKIPSLGILNSHAAWLPDYRGSDSHFWAILTKGTHGCTEHFIDSGVDTGPILVQRKLKIFKNDTFSSILRRNHYQNKWQGVADALIGIQKGRLTPIPQKKTEGKQYFQTHDKLKSICYQLMKP